MVKILLQQGLAVLFLGLEIVIELAFRHAGRFQYLIQANARKALAGNDPVTGFENVLARIVVTNVHGKRDCHKLDRSSSSLKA